MTDLDIQLQRKLVLTPCNSREGFRDWLITYLNLDFPDTKVDEDSTESPLELLWRVYHAGVTNDPDFGSALLFASRGSYKTLGVAALELLAMLHMDRNVVHQAAIEAQSSQCQLYLREFLSRDDLDVFSQGNNKRTVAVVWCDHKQTGDILTWDEWRDLDKEQRKQYTQHSHYVKVIVNTAQSSNSSHVAFFVTDELDLIRFPQAFKESQFIPEAQRDVYGNEQPPISIYTSSRKYNTGLVQQLIDESETTGCKIWHWNILDVTSRCPSTRHRPDLPKQDVFVLDDELRVINTEEHAKLVEVDAKKALLYKQYSAYAGCTTNCRIFAACKGRLASVTSTAKLLKPLTDTIEKFRKISVDMCKAQLMCWRPGNEAGVYRHFNRTRHMLTIPEMWERLTGQPIPPNIPANKDSLIQKLKELGCSWHAGLDWGFTHNFAGCLFAQYGRVAYLTDCFEVAQLELNQKIELCNRRIKEYRPKVWADPAYPSDILSFRKAGYSMGTFKKDVLGEINIFRSKLNPPGGVDPELFMLKGDVAGELFARRIEAYRWKLDAQGNATDVPDDTEDDLMDSGKYCIANMFSGATKIHVGADMPKKAEPAQAQVDIADGWLKGEIDKALGTSGTRLASGKIGKGSFFFQS